ncbi:MAG: hypothetical protein OJF51_004343 [Nitrospira sp.]|jgi:hypothetical protein|nr:MAG: hypothetical protein OJF51_004343 [Nitrospira sp.]
MFGKKFASVGMGILGLVWLTNCAEPARVGEYPNQKAMTGKTGSDILACAGRPTSERKENDVTVLRYYREAPILEESQPIGKSSVSTVRHGCWATVVLAEDRVIDIRYRFVPPSFDASNDCEEIFAPCMQ